MGSEGYRVLDDGAKRSSRRVGRERNGNRERDKSTDRRTEKERKRSAESGDLGGRALRPKAPGTCPRRPDVCFAT